MTDYNVLISTVKNENSENTILLCNELQKIIPNSIYTQDILTTPIKIQILEHNKLPYTIKIAYKDIKYDFKIIEYKSTKALNNQNQISGYNPQLVVNNFNTDIGTNILNILMELFPYDFSARNRQVVNFTNKNDYIFFRMYRYIFKEDSSIDFAEIGPRLILKLSKIIDNENTFNIKYSSKKYSSETAII
ncbi:Brix domain-containing protein [Hamiltosporidium tvaerminnensis]|uniref:Brix domain-containing protein n=1 Tax=Hamiltosporidium tvaerminnensis TaxID=1176355 RepID=A0A4Q9L202_9MICR|nr:Brix domain-containing protein [Hamiltosporidium tvaerminnensis]